MVPTRKFTPLMPDSPQAECSGFKQSVLWKFTLHETGCLEPVPLLYNLLQWKNNKYYILWSVFIALAIQHAMRMRHIIMCPAPLCNIFNIIL